MTGAAFHLTVPSISVALTAAVLAVTGCSGMMNTSTSRALRPVALGQGDDHGGFRHGRRRR